MFKRMCKGISNTFFHEKKEKNKNIPETIRRIRTDQVEISMRLGITHNVLIVFKGKLTDVLKITWKSGETHNLTSIAGDLTQR